MLLLCVGAWAIEEASLPGAYNKCGTAVLRMQIRTAGNDTGYFGIFQNHKNFRVYGDTLWSGRARPSAVRILIKNL